MKRKKLMVFGVVLVLIAMMASVVYANQVWRWRGTGTIVNADTFAVLTHFELFDSGRSTREAAQRNIRMQLGFPSRSDERTVNGVTQRIMWASLEEGPW